MTARRRRKTGSGPSAAALIAWVGGAQSRLAEPVSASLSVPDGGSCDRVSVGRAVRAGRACGLAAGTVLACVSVLVGAAYVGDGSPAGESASPFRGALTVPMAGVGTANEYRGNDYRGHFSAGRTSTVPDMVSAQAVAGANPAPRARLGRVRRNTPVSLDRPAEAHRSSAAAQRPCSPPPSADPALSGPVTVVTPLLGPTAKQVGRVAPVGEVLTPTDPRGRQAGRPHDDQAGSLRGEAVAGPRDELASLSPTGGSTAVKRLIAPVRNVLQPAAQPAMVRLASVLPLS
jgi:hypothetical protein